MKIKFFDKIHYQTFPITEDMIDLDITEKDLEQIGITKCFENNKIVDFFNPTKRINELKKLLCETDYKAIKFAEGELSAEDYLPIKQKRRAYRAEINSLEEKLKNNA